MMINPRRVLTFSDVYTYCIPLRSATRSISPPSAPADNIGSKGSAMDGFEWDANKEAKNIEERGLDFTTASRIWGGSVLERIDVRQDYGEVRTLAFGKVDGRLMAVLYTWRGVNRRIISARKANRREQRRFEEEMENPARSVED